MLQDAVASLPCLFSNNSTESLLERAQSGEQIHLDPPASIPHLSVAHKRSACALAWNVDHFCEESGLENVGFLTLTFPSKVLDRKVAQKHWNSFRTHFLAEHFPRYIRVFERQKSGSIHYHVLIDVGQDIRTGINWHELENRNYKSASKALRAIWELLREEAPKYGFGRTELLPVRTNANAMGKYVGKYIGKHFEERLWQDKGVRLVEYSRAARMCSSRFQFVTPGSKEWRAKLRNFAESLGSYLGREMQYEDLRQVLGDRWAYNNRGSILASDQPLVHDKPAPARPDRNAKLARQAPDNPGD